ncbi:DUF5955 family protein [Actinacidiphila acidipaludis]|uniref:DUF5955 family protein n=1 Tax=Actinacidiphila acidipaludis TaxID=2873382 RepID=A0ABS7QGW4_9ACTN|nr:DUF5955 family protein [Streptomyces acidipaludis]MBY8882414.1 DUF5955 family protein [Streptomyces acidipaludis]
MSGGTWNVGIHQSGSGRIDNSGPMAVGEGAQVNVGGAPDGGLTPAQALDVLGALLAAHGAQLSDEDRARARGELGEVTDQLAAPAPDPGRLSRAIARLTTAVSSVTALASAADALREAVTRAIG